MTPDPTLPDRFNLADYFLFDRLREGLAGKECLRFGAHVYTYGDVARRARAFAAVLAQVDIRRGERVLIVLPDVPPFAWTLFGALARGCVIAMANPDAPIETLEYLVDYTRATSVITVPRVAAALLGGIRSGRSNREVRRVWCVAEVCALSGSDDPETDTGEHNGIVRSLARDLRAIDPTFATVVTHRDEPAIWLFTSGSTGDPKANIHSHRDFAFSTEMYAKRTVGYREGDLTLSVPRLFFGYATGTNLLFPLAVGATAALFSERPTPESLVRAIQRYRPTIVTNVPTMLGKLLDHDRTLRDLGEPGLDLSSIRFSLSAGEALPAPLLRQWLDRFGSDVYDGIGSAEMFHIYASNRPGNVKPGSLGRAVEGYDVRILPADACGPGAEPVAQGEIGVLWVKGDSVSHGYWLDREKSWKTMHGHWCRTGDLFRMDADGYLYFVGRADELLKVSGLWVAPAEVEECIAQHEAVLHAAIIGTDENGLLKTKAFVMLRAGFTGCDALAAELQAFVKAKLAKHKYPRVVEFIDDMPRNDRGKIDRRLLARRTRDRETRL
jgi:benzoate-CoA ligase family protein